MARKLPETAVRINYREFSRCESIFGAFRKICEARLLASSCLSACPSIRMQQLGSRTTNFHETLYLSVFRKSVQKIQD